MSSGIKVTDEVKNLFNKMKVVKHEDDQMERIRILVCQISDTVIEVEKIIRQKQVQDQDVFKVFQGLLVAKECRYIVYDCHFESKESSKKEELIFVLWSPDNAFVKDKMGYASSATALRNAVKGVKHDLEIHDFADCADRATFAENLEKNIRTLEGHPCNEQSH